MLARARGASLWLRLTVLCALLVGCGGPIPVDLVLDRGETLRIHGAQPATLDPALSTDSVSWSYLLQIFSGLVRLDHQMQIVPDLAEKWEISPDGRVYRFTIRSDARFHSGRQVVADDFVYGMQRALAPATRSPVARAYLGDIVGADDLTEGRAPTLRGARAVDSRTLELEIDAPKNYFLSKLTYPTAFALDRVNVETGANWFERPNGTGPFRLGGWERENKLVLVRFNQHWAGAAKVKEVEFNLSPVPGVVLYEQGEIDVSELGPADLDRVTDPRNPLSREVVEAPLLSTWYVGMNTSAAPFDDPAVRRAFALATDRERLARVYHRGTRPAAYGILPPGLPGFDSEARAPALDPAAARRSLMSSRYAGRLPEVVLSVGPGSGPTGEALAEMYSRNLGIDVGVREWNDAYFEALENRRAQLFLTGWVADYPHPENFLDLLFHSRSRHNYGGFRSGPLDTTLESARVERDDRARADLYRRAERLILDEAAAIPLHYEVNRALVRPYVKNLVYTPLGVLSYRDVEVLERPARRAA